MGAMKGPYAEMHDAGRDRLPVVAGADDRRRQGREGLGRKTRHACHLNRAGSQSEKAGT